MEWKLHGKPSSFPISKFAHAATQEDLLPTPPTPKSKVPAIVAVPVDEYACLRVLCLTATHYVFHNYLSSDK